MSAAPTKALETAQTFIAENKVAIFTKSYCPYCAATKKLLNELGAEFAHMDLDTLDDQEEAKQIQQAAASLSNGQTTVPNIFIVGNHVGGNSDIQKLATEGNLEGILKDAGAL